MNKYKITTLTGALGRGYLELSELLASVISAISGGGWIGTEQGRAFQTESTVSAKALWQRDLSESKDWKVGSGAGGREEGEVVSWVGERGEARHIGLGGVLRVSTSI